MYKYYSSTIQKGSKGDEVKEWQKFLQSQGYDFSQYGGIDGIFGDATDSYTRDWQQKNGIGADGIVGEKTWGKAGYTYLSPTAPTAKEFNTDATDLPTIDTTPYDETTEGGKAKDAYETAKDKVNAHNKKGFTFSEQEWLNKIKESIENYGEFSYNFNEDALYQQAVDRYSQMGKMAMADTMGQAAAMTGGYGNSYAQSVGQQTYQEYLQEAHDMLPEFYQMALDRYQMGKDDLYNQYGMLLSEYEREYGLHSDEYQKLLDALGIASDTYYKGGEIYRTEQDIKNDAEWDEYNAKEAAREYANKLTQQGYENEFKEWEANTENYWKDKTYDAQYGSSDNGGNKGVMYDENGNLKEGYTTTDPSFFDENGNFKKASFSHYDSNGNAVWYIDGKEVVRQLGANPYNGEINPDLLTDGTYDGSKAMADRSYQPNNVEGQELSKYTENGVPVQDEVNGVMQNVWETPDGKRWIWDVTQNKYLSYTE